MEYGLIGEHLLNTSYTFLKMIHEHFASCALELCELRPDEVEAFLRAGDFKGIHVTSPYEQTVIPCLDEISDRARSIGAVNTIVHRDGKLVGYNTEYDGMKSLIKKIGIEMSGRKVLILGTGGMSRTACAVAKDMGAAEVFRISRTGREGALTYPEAFEKHADADILINTTPCGMDPDLDGCPVDLDRFPNLSGLVDTICDPLRTTLVLEAKKRGIPAEGGLYMLVDQTIRAMEYFTAGKSDSVEKTDSVGSKAVGSKAVESKAGIERIDIRAGIDSIESESFDRTDSVESKAGIERIDNCACIDSIESGSFDRTDSVGSKADVERIEYSESMKGTDSERTSEIFAQILNAGRNIVLTGMSLAGKTTLGTMLSRELGRKLEDTDQMIIEREQRSITDIFATDGESYFRDLETQMCRILAPQHGLVIATGGGAILREENVDLLKKNGCILFLDRPLDQILPADDRPLANTKEKVVALWKKRYPIYQSICDASISNDLTPEKGMEKILAALQIT